MTDQNLIDARGLRCPEPLELWSDDPVSARDVPAYCRFLGHELIAAPDQDHPCRYIVKKGLK